MYIKLVIYGVFNHLMTSCMNLIWGFVVEFYYCTYYELSSFQLQRDAFLLFHCLPSSHVLFFLCPAGITSHFTFVFSLIRFWTDRHRTRRSSNSWEMDNLMCPWGHASFCKWLNFPRPLGPVKSPLLIINNSSGSLIGNPNESWKGLIWFGRRARVQQTCKCC